MRIKRLRLEGYERLLLRNIKVFEIRITSAHQMIIGTNGSGKSSVMYELSPLPAQGSHFIKGGSKTIELEHAGKTYVLMSDFSLHSGKHSFLVDGDVNQNLNPGGTATVQKELIKQYFNYDDSLHRILTGIHRFSTMPALARRDVLVQLSGCNLDYAMEIWKQLKTRKRDMQGVVKHTATRLAHETEKLPTESELKALTDKADSLKTELVIAMEALEPNLEEASHRKQQLTQSIQALTGLFNETLRCYPKRPAFTNNESINSVDDINDIIIRHEKKQAADNQLLEHYHAEFNKVRDIVGALQKTNAAGIEDLKQTSERLKDERDAIINRISLFKDIEGSTAKVVSIKTNAIFPELVELFSTLPDNSNRRYSRENREKAASKHTALLHQRTNIQSAVGKLEHRLEHINNAKQEKCPDCGYVWIPGIRKGEEAELSTNIEKGHANLKQITDQITDIENYLEAFKSYSEIYRRFQRVVESTPDLTHLWDYVMNNDRQFTNPRTMLPVLDQWQHDIQLHAEAFDVTAQIELYDAATIKAASLTGSEAYGDRIDSISENIHSLTQSLNAIEKDISELKRYRDACKHILQNVQTHAVKHIADIERSVDLLVRIARRDHLRHAIKEHQSTLAHAENALVQARSIADVVNDLTKSHLTVKQDFDAFALLESEISPIDGLIADQIKGFIETFVAQFNAIIAQVWTYPLAIKPCGTDAGELDYKFPVQVNNEPAGSDVRESEVSTGQLEVIDFAFHILVMLYLGLDDYPLHIDELGTHMDEQHRINIMHFVRSLVETKRCSQLFMISHYAASHGIFTNAEICVMDDRNIHLPTTYNNHVTLV